MGNTFRRLFLGLALLSAVGCAATAPQHGHKFASKANTYETDVLGLVLNGTAVASIADNAAAAPLTNLYIAFATGDPGEAGDQTTSEATFPGYGRTAIGRSPGAPQWTVSSIGGVGTAKNTNAITGPTYTVGAGSPQTLTFFDVGTSSSGAGKILYSGALTNSLIVNPGITIQIAANALVITED
jgi:hypothetical protein